MKAGGVLRFVVAGGVATGLVYAAGQSDAQVDLTRARDRATTIPGAASSGLATASVTCPGPDRGITAAAPQAARRQVSVLSATGPTAVLPPGTTVRAGGAGRAVSLPGELDPRSSAQPTPTGTARGTVTDTVVTGDRAIRLDSTAAMAPGSTADQYSYDGTRSARGSSYLQCTAPTQDAWVLTGGTDPGRVTRVALSNPGDSAITVNVAVVGSMGRDPSSVAGKVIGPGRRAVLTMGALRTGADPAFHVTSSGGPVAIAASDVWMDGETAVGMETTGVSAPAATTSVLPVVPVLGPAPVVRVLDPGAEDAVVRVRATAANGAIGTEKVLTVPAGRTGSAALTGLRPGVYTVQVRSDVPVVAAASVRSTASGAGDITWAAGADPVRDLTGAVLPTDQASVATLGVTAPTGAAQIVVRTVDAAGAVRSTTRTLAPGTPILQPVPGARSVWVTVRSGSVRVAVSVTGRDGDGALLATTSLAGLPVRAQTVPVRPDQD